MQDPARFQRITAVVVNADAAAAGYSARHLDWRYLTEETPFRISGRIVRMRSGNYTLHGDMSGRVMRILVDVTPEF